MFTTLTQKQKLTIRHLKELGLKEPLQIIEFCVKKLNLPSRKNHRKHKELRVPGRKHPRQHYQGIVNYLAQGNLDY